MIFGSYPQGGTTKQLIVSNKDYSLRRVSVNDVDGKKQGLMVEAEAEMGPGKKVEEKRTHAPLNLRLGIDHGGITHGGLFHCQHVQQNLLTVLVFDGGRFQCIAFGSHLMNCFEPRVVLASGVVDGKKGGMRRLLGSGPSIC